MTILTGEDFRQTIPRKNMTYREREVIKGCFGKEASEVLCAISHWMRQQSDISFTEYVSQWIVSMGEDDRPIMRESWPLEGRRKIATGYSDYGSFGHPGYKVQELKADEVEIGMVVYISDPKSPYFGLRGTIRRLYINENQDVNFRAQLDIMDEGVCHVTGKIDSTRLSK